MSVYVGVNSLCVDRRHSVFGGECRLDDSLSGFTVGGSMIEEPDVWPLAI